MHKSTVVTLSSISVALTKDSRAHRSTKLLGGAGQGKTRQELSAPLYLACLKIPPEAKLKAWRCGQTAVRDLRCSDGRTGWGMNYIRTVFGGYRERKKIIKDNEVFKWPNKRRNSHLTISSSPTAGPTPIGPTYSRSAQASSTWRAIFCPASLNKARQSRGVGAGPGGLLFALTLHV